MKIKLNFTGVISIIFFLTLITFLLSNIIIGGDALSGKVEDNKYFVWDATHKTDNQGDKLFFEVSKSVYYYSLGITYLCFSMLLVFLFFRIKEILKNKIKKLHLSDHIK
jgi:preprotein translocase subunit SecY